MEKGIIRAVCISSSKGTEKKNVHSAMVREDWGIEGDAHAGTWHRQVSLLSWQKVQEFNLQEACVTDGAFGENLLVDGIDCARLPVGTILRSGDVLLEVTQIGKECHHGCSIQQRVGYCIMPHEGIFTRVLHGGIIREGDEISVISKENLEGVTSATVNYEDGTAVVRTDGSVSFDDMKQAVEAEDYQVLT